MKARTGFTLVEILIVVVILGILAAIVIPQFTDAGSETRISTVRANLSAMRSQIEIYKNRTGAFPSELDTLVGAGCLLKIPDEPFGGNWNYAAATGVVTSSTDSNW